MKTRLLTCFAMRAALSLAAAQTTDPVADFQKGLAIRSRDKILRWECDVNGDGKNEILLSLKSDYDEAVKNHLLFCWTLYLAQASGLVYVAPKGIETAPDTIDSGLPAIDPAACFIGQITELGKRGVVTMKIKNPRAGEAIATIYAYTIEGDYLKETELVKFEAVKGHALYTKYLAEDRRTKVTIQEVRAQAITNPVQHFAGFHNLTGGDRIKRIEVDLNGDGTKDLLLAYEDPNPDAVERAARKKEGGVVRWDAYIKGAGGNYTFSTGVEKNGQLSSGAPLSFHPDEVHAGQVPEISLYALVTFQVLNVKGKSATETVVAYTWEGDHFKKHTLATYSDGEKNAIFDKYLARDKRTSLTVQDVTP